MWLTLWNHFKVVKLTFSSSGFGVGHMRDTKTKGNVSSSLKKSATLRVDVIYNMSLISCRDLGLGNPAWIGHQWSKNFCVLPWYRGIWKYWEIKCLWWSVNFNLLCNLEIAICRLKFYVYVSFLTFAFSGFLLWQLFWALWLFIICLRRLVFGLLTSSFKYNWILVWLNMNES